jgi:hypothetical protein
VAADAEVVDAETEPEEAAARAVPEVEEERVV